MTPTVEDVKSLPDLLALLEKSPISRDRHAHVRVWFRGQSKFGLQLVPGVYRSKLGEMSDSERLNTEQHLTQDFRVQSSGLRRGRNTHPEIYFLQQHYRMPTRLLDWTTNPLAALYFAVSGNLQEDAQLFVMDAYKLAITQKQPESVFRGVGTERNDVLLKSLRVIFDWGKIEDFADFIFPVRPDHSDQRISSQGSCFTFHVPKRTALTTKENNTLRSFRIPSGSKANIKKELFLLGIDDFSIYADLENLSLRLLNAHSLI